MTIEEQLFAALAPLVGNRAYPLHAPDAVARPYIVFSTISGVGSYTLGKHSNVATRTRVEVNLYDDDSKPYTGFDSLSKQVAAAVEAIGGQLTDSGRERESETRLRRSRQDFYLWDRT